MRTRIVWIDNLRGIAILLVVLGHVVNNPIVLKVICSFHVPLFFIISGILIEFNTSWKNLSNKNLVMIKAKKLLYPYAVFSILLCIVRLVRGGVQSSIQVIIDSVTFSGYEALWFLPALFIGETMFCLICKKRNITRDVLILFVITLLSQIGQDVLSYLQIQDSIFFIYYLRISLLVIYRGMVSFAFLIIGFHISELLKGQKKIYHLTIIISMLLICGLWLCGAVQHVDLNTGCIGNAFIYYSIAAGESLILIYLIQFKMENESLLSFFGTNSLLIFATHLEVIHLIREYMPHNLNSILYVGFVFVIVLIVEVLLILIVNRYKILIRNRLSKNS